MNNIAKKNIMFIGIGLTILLVMFIFAIMFLIPIGGIIFQGSKTPSPGAGCVQSSTGTINNTEIFTCDADRCAVELTVPVNMFTYKTVSSFSFQTDYHESCGMRGIQNICTLNGKKAFPSCTEGNIVGYATQLADAGCKLYNVYLDGNCRVQFQNEYYNNNIVDTIPIIYSPSSIRPTCNGLIGSYLTFIFDRDIEIYDLNQKQIYNLNVSIIDRTDVNSNTLTGIYVSRGGYVKVPTGMIIKYTKYNSCIMCKGTDMCSIGSKQCLSGTAINAYQSCVDDGAGCGLWGTTEYGSINQKCIGAGTLICANNVCTTGQKLKDSDTSYKTCIKTSDGCYKWSDVSYPCPTGQVFDNNAQNCVCAVNECTANSKLKVSNTQYKLCTQTTGGCYKWSDTATSCPTGQVFNDVTQSCSCPIVDGCSDTTINTKRKISDNSYQTCQKATNEVCPTWKDVTCKTGESVLGTTDFYCGIIPKCNIGQVRCSDDKKTVESCVLNSVLNTYTFATSKTCQANEQCYNNNCKVVADVSFTADQYLFGQGLTFIVYTKDLITGDNSGFTVSASILDQNNGLVDKYPTSPISSSDGRVVFNFDALSNPDTYILKITARKEEMSVMKTFNFDILREMGMLIESDVQQYNNQDIIAYVNVYDKIATTFSDLSRTPIVSVNIGGSVLTPSLDYVSKTTLSNGKDARRYKITLKTDKVGTAKFSVTVEKTGYATLTKTFNVDIANSFLILDTTQITPFIAPGIHSFTITLKSPQGTLTDASLVKMKIIGPDPTKPVDTVTFDKVSLGTYKMTYNFYIAGFYDTTIQITPVSGDVIEKPISINAIGNCVGAGCDIIIPTNCTGSDCPPPPPPPIPIYVWIFLGLLGVLALVVVIGLVFKFARRK